MGDAAATRLLALLGDPVDHSLSPRIQNAAIEAAGLNAVYLALRCEKEDLGPLLRGLARAGAGGNVTVPHKERAAAALDARARSVERTGACNTFWLEGGRVTGDNTDVEGFAAAARALIGSPAGARVLVLGAGGAARAVIAALMDERAHTVDLLNRTPARAAAVRDALDPGGRRVAVLDANARLQREGYDLVVNATSLGLQPGDPPPLDLGRLARVGAVLDLTYRPGGTDWVRQARRGGLSAADGTAMLLHQAAAAFRRWFDVAPDLAAMERAIR